MSWFKTGDRQGQLVCNKICISETLRLTNTSYPVCLLHSKTTKNKQQWSVNKIQWLSALLLFEASQKNYAAREKKNIPDLILHHIENTH